MRTGETADSLIARIYDAAADQKQWPDAVAQASRMLGAHSAQNFTADWSMGQPVITPLVEHRMDPDRCAQWREEYVDKDLWTLALAPRLGNGVATGASVVDKSELRRSVLYNDLLRAERIEDLLCTVLADQDDVHTVLSFYSSKSFQRPQIELLQRLRPHFLSAVRLQRQLASVRARAEAAEAALDALMIGVLILDAAGRVVHANGKAEAILNARDGLGLFRRRLRCELWTETAALHAAIAKAAEATLRRTCPNESPLAVSRPSLRRPFSVLVAPLPQRFRERSSLVEGDGRRRGAVLVTITDPEERPLLPADRLVKLFGLTPAEARLAAALAADQSLDDYAQRAEITKGTARWTLRFVLEKTGCRRQSELVHLLVTSVAGLVWTD